MAQLRSKQAPPTTRSVREDFRVGKSIFVNDFKSRRSGRTINSQGIFLVVRDDHASAPLHVENHVSFFAAETIMQNQFLKK